jgi:hypothetical protein
VKTKGMGGRGIRLAHVQGQVFELVGSVVLNILHAGIFLLDANMKFILPFHSLVTIQSTWVPTRSASFRLPLFPPASPTRSVYIQLPITDCGNGASG